MSTVDWVPKNHEALYNQATQTYDYIIAPANKVRMGFAVDSPQGDWFDHDFVENYGHFTLAFNKWKNPATRTEILTAALNDAEGKFIPIYRQLYKGFLKDSPLVTDADLVAMGLPERSGGGHHPTPVAQHAPFLSSHAAGPREVVINFGASETSRAKPEGQHGMELVAIVSDTPPAEISEMTTSYFDTHSPITLEFIESQRGKSLYFAGRWENTRGEKGPWSEIFHTIIP